MPVDVSVTYSGYVERIQNAFPYGGLDLPRIEELLYCDFEVSPSAKCNVVVAGGGLARLAEHVRVLRGHNKIKVDGQSCILAVGSNTTLENSAIEISGKGSAVIIGANCRLRGLKIIVKREGSLVAIGPGTTWESGAILSESGNIVAVGEDCMMSSAVVLRTSDGHSIFDAATREQINESDDVFVGNHVWLGNSARVNKGASIGSGTIVGQCSIVSGSLSSRCIYAGVPARKLRENVVWSRTGDYLDVPEEFR